MRRRTASPSSSSSTKCKGVHERGGGQGPRGEGAVDEQRKTVVRFRDEKTG